eukprot:6249229-Lingulodinium_polyedra.AAC.1
MDHSLTTQSGAGPAPLGFDNAKYFSELCSPGLPQADWELQGVYFLRCNGTAFRGDLWIENDTTNEQLKENV